ncbi:MAG: hypothetical protein KDA63_16325 [Planctomycetales bacterium]|nr:hypothetical protein [Planctomycetales bacterium]
MSTTKPSPHSSPSSHKFVAESRRPLIKHRGIAWHKTAPAALRRLGRDTDGPGWEKWRSHLAKRKTPRPLSQLLDAGPTALLWAFADEDARVARVVRLSDDGGTGGKKRRGAKPKGQKSSAAKNGAVVRQAREWLETRAVTDWSVAGALEQLAWCHAMPALASRLDTDLWWQLLQRMVDTADEALSADFSRLSVAEQLLVEQLFAGELPLTLAYLFPELKPCRRLRRAAKKVLTSGIIEWTDGEGMPAWHAMEWLRPLLACWTRCCALGEGGGTGCWTSDAQNQYDWLVRQAMRLSRPDGSQVFVHAPSGAWSADLFAAAVRFGADDADRRVAHAIWPSSRLRPDKPKGGRSLPDASEHSGWSELAVLRTDWRPRGPALHVAYGGEQMAVELFADGKQVFDGLVETTITAEESLLEFTSGWEEVCWIADEDVVYLELEASLSGGFTLHRHLALGREDGLLLIADGLVGDPAQMSDMTSLYHRLSLPVSTGFDFAPEDETREGYLYTGRRRYLAQPLALPEWRVDPRRGSLALEAGRLQLVHEAVGRTMFTPLLLDLDSRRGFTASTWRQLTVAQDLKIQPASVAVGYRSQIGKKNWLVYRSLAQPAPRTVLGQHLGTEFLFARFGRDGKLKQLIEVEGSDGDGE